MTILSTFGLEQMGHNQWKKEPSEQTTCPSRTSSRIPFFSNILEITSSLWCKLLAGPNPRPHNGRIDLTIDFWFSRPKQKLSRERERASCAFFPLFTYVYWYQRDGHVVLEHIVAKRLILQNHRQFVPRWSSELTDLWMLNVFKAG